MKAARKNAGFTLIELIVVITLISIILAFTVPRLQNSTETDNANELSRYFFAASQQLRENSFRQQKRFTLCIDMDKNTIFISGNDIGKEAEKTLSRNSRNVSEEITFLNVERPGDILQTGGTAEINFYPGGYSDPAIIHFANSSGDRFSFVIEPFLNRGRFYSGTIGFADL